MVTAAPGPHVDVLGAPGPAVSGALFGGVGVVVANVTSEWRWAVGREREVAWAVVARTTGPDLSLAAVDVWKRRCTDNGGRSGGSHEEGRQRAGETHGVGSKVGGEGSGGVCGLVGGGEGDLGGKVAVGVWGGGGGVFGVEE